MAQTAKKWRKTLIDLAREFGLQNVEIEISKSNHYKLYCDKKLVMTASSTPGDPAIIHAYRRQLRAFVRQKEGA